MNKTIINFALLLACSIPANTYAQTITTEQRRSFNLKVVDLLEQYEELSIIYDNTSEREFCRLFEDKESQIYNDLLGLSEEKRISVTDYAKLIKTESQSPLIKIKNVKRGDITDTESKWLMNIEFDKSIVYSNQCGVLLSSEEYYECDHHIQAVISMDKKTKACKFASIEGSVDSNKPSLTGDFVVIGKHSSMDDKALYKGRTLSFNTFSQAILPANATVESPDENLGLKMLRDVDGCNIFSLKWSPKYWRLKLRAEFALGSFYTLEGPNKFLGVTSTASDFGLDLGYVFPSRGKVKTALYIGASYSLSQMSLDQSRLNFSYMAGSEADIDGDTYQRYYKDMTLQQEIKINSLLIPVYLDFSYRIIPMIDVFANIGVKSYLNLDSKVSDTNGSAEIYGIYSQYDDLILDGNFGYNGFGKVTFNDSNLENAKVDVNTLSLDAFAGLGIRFNIPQTSLSLEVGANYQMGIIDPISNGDSKSSPALSSYSIQKGETISNLAESSESLSRDAINLNAGLIIKF